MRFRSKPKEIEAIRASEVIHLARVNWHGLPKWLIDAYESKEVGKGILFRHDSVEILTLEGMMIANRDDWIIRGIDGEIYPCRADIFAKSYEPIP